MRTQTYFVSLTDEELVLLDGNCREDIQNKVDEAKQRLAVKLVMVSEHADIISALVIQAKKDGELKFLRGYISHCYNCGTGTTYVKYKTGRNRGLPNYNKPIKQYGVEVGHRYLCDECWKKLRVDLINALQDVKAEISKHITGEIPKWKKEYVYQCQCGWKGRSGLMVRSETLMGDGTYPSACPECGARNKLFLPEVFKWTSEFEVVEND